MPSSVFLVLLVTGRAGGRGRTGAGERADTWVGLLGADRQDGTGAETGHQCQLDDFHILLTAIPGDNGMGFALGLDTGFAQRSQMLLGTSITISERRLFLRRQRLRVCGQRRKSLRSSSGSDRPLIYAAQTQTPGRLTRSLRLKSNRSADGYRSRRSTCGFVASQRSLLNRRCGS